MASGVLIDTNIFLEVALEQRRKDLCRKILNDREGELCISDFGLHSAGIILFRNKKLDVFDKFLRDVNEAINVLILPSDSYPEVVRIHLENGLDFDDSYQLGVAEHYQLELLTLDSDFKDVDSSIKVTLIS